MKVATKEIRLVTKTHTTGIRGKFNYVYCQLLYPGWELELGSLRVAKSRLTVRVRASKKDAGSA